MSALTLYEIHDELQAWSNSLELAATPEERAEIEQRISAWLQAGRDKVDSFNAYLSHLEAQTELAKKEVDRINAIRRKIERVQGELEDYAVRTMEVLGVRKLEGHTSSLALRAKPPSVLIDGAVPFEFQRATIEIDADTYNTISDRLPPNSRVVWYAQRAEISKAIKAGRDVPGATLSIGQNGLVRK